MKNQEVLKIAMARSAIDLCAAPADFEKVRTWSCGTVDEMNERGRR